MNSDVARLLRWLRRAQPPRGALARALVSGLVGSATNVGLFVCAIALLVVSATRPGLRAVAGVLIVIELIAFLRSPIRYNERLSAHRLGFQAVTRWRRWLVTTIGRWDFTTWRSYASGDLLERSLRDTDELQDLWLRCVVPAFATLATLDLGDLLIGLLPPHGGWWPYVGLLAAIQLLGLVALFANVAPLVRADRGLRSARGAYQATLVELSAVTPELSLLGRDAFLDNRSLESRHALRGAERRLRRQRRASSVVAPLVTVSALGALALGHPSTSPVWTVVVALIAFSSYESFATLRSALDTAVAVSAAAERLEELDTAPRTGDQPWPGDSTLRAANLTLREGDQVLLSDVSFEVASRRRVAVTGPSGSGKSTLLRALSALDQVDAGVLTVGGIPLSTIDESDLRRHLIYLPSEPGLTRGFALDVIRLGRAGTRDAQDDLAALGVGVESTTRWDELSRGERQRVAIARAMVTNRFIYLLDEPTSGLGREETDAVLSLLASTGATVVVATHDPLVMAWCDEVLEMREGSLRVLSR